MNKYLSSLQNPLIKELVLLKEKSRHRKNTQSFLLEGKREILLAAKGKYQVSKLFYCSTICSKEMLASIENSLPIGVEIFEISKDIYTKIAYRQTTEGVVAIVGCKKHALDEIIFKRKNPLILVAEAPEKPGNIGALLRTADAANIDAVFIADPKTDVYNPNIIRSSVGCLFTTQIGIGTSQEIINYLNGHKIHSYAALLSDDAEPYQIQDFSKATAIVVGTEATGLSNLWTKAVLKKIIIPMSGEIDSLNVSVAAAILVFEATRQRSYKV